VLIIPKMRYQPESALGIAFKLYEGGFEQGRRLYDQLQDNFSKWPGTNIKISKDIFDVYDALKEEVEGKPEGLVRVLNDIDPSLGGIFSRLPEQGLVANYLLDVLFSRPIIFKTEGDDVVRVFGRKRTPFVYGKGFWRNEMDNADKVLKILDQNSPFGARQARLSYLHCLGDLTEELAEKGLVRGFQQFVESEMDFFSKDTETRLYAMSDLFRHDWFSTDNLLRYKDISNHKNVTQNIKLLALRANDDVGRESKIRLPVTNPNLTDLMNHYVDLATDEGRGDQLTRLYQQVSNLMFDEGHIKKMGPYYQDQYQRFGSSDPQSFVTEMIFEILCADGVKAANTVVARLK